MAFAPREDSHQLGHCKVIAFNMKRGSYPLSAQRRLIKDCALQMPSAFEMLSLTTFVAWGIGCFCHVGAHFMAYL